MYSFPNMVFPLLVEGVFLLVRNINFMYEMVDNKNKQDFSYLPEKQSLNENFTNSKKYSTVLHELEKFKKTFGYNGFITIEDQSHMELILKSYADIDKRKILETTYDASKSIMEIFDSCNVPQTSAYRKVTSLIEDGLLIPDTSVFRHGRKITKYRSIFENVEINIIRDKVTITVKLTTRK
ncbi:MAG TPA: hypothetical protein VEJ68_00505 [Candidatus Bathyarchaeia archaeon]|nr:hypothetical protein [Candidatus Bathyarchaeia archaeon]